MRLLSFENLQSFSTLHQGCLCCCLHFEESEASHGSLKTAEVGHFAFRRLQIGLRRFVVKFDQVLVASV